MPAPDLDSYDRFVVAMSGGKDSMNIRARADRGRPYLAALEQPGLAAAALRHEWNEPIRVAPSAWQMPAGAFGTSVGPS